MSQQEPAGNLPLRSHEDSLAAILACLPRGAGGERRKLLEEFVGLWLNHAPSEVAAGQADDDTAGAALAHWDLADGPATADGPRYRIINPVYERDGWQSSHTILQLNGRDRPWLLSSLSSALERDGHGIHVVVHPVVAVTRSADGRIAALGESVSTAGEMQMESLIHLEMDCIPTSGHPAIEALVAQVFATLDVINRDREALREQLDGMAESVRDVEQAEFVRWLDERQFLCIGAGRIIPNSNPPGGTSIDDQALQPRIESALGILAADAGMAAWTIEDLLSKDLASMFIDDHDEVVICKASRSSPVVRDEPADLILVPERDAAGKLVSINAIVGLFVTGLQNEAVNNIPWLRGRIERVVDAAGMAADSHDGKALVATLRSLPREMLLQTGSARLLEMTRGIIALTERRQVRLFSSTDSVGRYCNCLVFIPREAYSRDLRLDIERILANHIDGTSTGFDIRFASTSALARLHFVIRKHPPLARDIHWADIEKRVRQAAVTWGDKLDQALRTQHDESAAIELATRYASAFPPGYREDYSARAAAADIAFIENHVTSDAPVMSFFRHIIADAETINFKLFVRHVPAALSDVIPVIENMGLRVVAEHPFEIRRRDADVVWIHEFTVEQTHAAELTAAELAPTAATASDHPAGTAVSATTAATADVTPLARDPAIAEATGGAGRTTESAPRISEAFGRIWSGEVENDGFNRLILAANLEWRQVVLIRALCKYLLQTRVPFSQAYMIDSIVGNAGVARMIVELFEQRFDPSKSSHDTTAIEQRIDVALDQVASLDEDRILRAFRSLVLATIRTNAYRRNANDEPLDRLSLKIDSARVPDLPLPRPMFEIFVYSSAVEGIHLRGGPVARGGLRWSDRREDFRTEVLGLMKAQMVKNAVIVPVGSKGGFYVKKHLPEDREASQAIVIECYKTFLRGLLDITDNFVDGAVAPPQDVVRHDSDDPYLVVAADKGTATFSDHANAVAIDYGFWLGDAFASGGSVGYDHKKMGITARGAWESVKRHFRGLGIDTQNEPFDVVGIGDMGGDVFGNGMLLSRKIRLVAAFNHLHIFIDPDPDPEASFEERARLFALPRSSWSDYDASLISAGGGIFARTDKQIRLSAEAREALGIEDESMTPNALISAILKAPVDLLWNGGIGTYVKSANESHADAADRANDGLRIDGRELRCRVVGEGGNLGFTQQGRIEFAAGRGLIYTDAIDNSAGVDCSDHEVNIKILVNALVAADEMTMSGRDRLLESMTDEVGKLVLQDNYLQTQCIDIVHVDGPAALNEHARFMQFLEANARLDREIEYLPNAENIAERLADERGLTRPEIAVLVSYSKMTMYADLLTTSVPDDDALESTVSGYFPQALQDDFAANIKEHRLRREIIATLLTNEFVNRLGPTFAFRMQQELNVDVANVTSAFSVVREAFRMPELWSAIEALDNKVAADVQYRMHVLVRGLVERTTHWLLRSRRSAETIESLITRFQPGLDELVNAMPDCLGDNERETLDQRQRFFTDAGVPPHTALAVSRVVPMSSSLDIVEIATSLSRPVDTTAGVYFELGHRLELSWLRERIGELRASSHWHALATSELRSDLHYQQRHLTAEAAGATDDAHPAAKRIASWEASRESSIAKYRALIAEMKASSDVDFAMLSLAVNEVHKLLGADRPLAAVS